MKILVWRCKYGENYYDASTPEALEASSLEVLRNLVKDGYIFEPKDPMKHIEYSGIDLELARLTPEQIHALPTQSLRDEAIKHMKRFAYRYAVYYHEKHQYEVIQRLLNGETVVEKHNGKQRTFTAWSILQMRDGSEYENFSVADVWTSKE